MQQLLEQTSGLADSTVHPLEDRQPGSLAEAVSDLMLHVWWPRPAVMGARVAITGRDLARTDAAAREISATHGGQVVTFVADLSAQSEVRRLAEQVQDALPRIDVLVNNVGGYWNTRRVTVDGLERPSL